MKKPKKIKIAVEFEVREDVWLKLPDDLRDKGKLAHAGIYELTPADLVAFMVMGAAISLSNTKLNGASQGGGNNEQG
jgi:hypothetical protein